MRKSDSEKKTHFRAEGRIIHLDNNWYYLTREGERGPYNRKEDAELALDRFVNEASWIDEQRKAKLTTRLDDYRPKPDPKVWDNRPDSPD